MNLGELFTTDPWAEFDALPLPIQKWKAEYYLKMHKLHMKQHEKNKKKLTQKGRPKKWADDELEDISKQILEIMKSPEYKSRKDPREKDITAYVILIEQLFERPDMKKMLLDNKLKNPIHELWQQEIRKIAEAIKERVDNHKKRRKTGT